MKKILIVEDDRSIVSELEALLIHAGYEIEILKDFQNALEEVLKILPDLILLDINIPYLNGEVLLQSLRKVSNIPVIMVTSRASETDEVLSMSYGADDYVIKPYNPTILLLRIQAVLKRSEKTLDTVSFKDAVVYIQKGMIKKGDIEVFLTKMR